MVRTLSLMVRTLPLMVRTLPLMVRTRPLITYAGIPTDCLNVRGRTGMATYFV